MASLFSKIWPAASIERLAETYDRGSTLEVVLPGRWLSRVRSISESQLELTDDDGVKHRVRLDEPVDPLSTTVRGYGDLKLLTLAKAAPTLSRAPLATGQAGQAIRAH
jgi:hypothetical protein